MQTVSSLHKMSNPVFWENKKQDLSPDRIARLLALVSQIKKVRL